MDLNEAMQPPLDDLNPSNVHDLVQSIEVLQQALRDRGVDPERPRKVSGWAAPDGFRQLMDLIEDTSDKDKASSKLANMLEEFETAGEFDDMSNLADQLGSLAAELAGLSTAAQGWRDSDSGREDKADAREEFLNNLTPVIEAWNGVSAVGDPDEEEEEEED